MAKRDSDTDVPRNRTSKKDASSAVAPSQYFRIYAPGFFLRFFYFCIPRTMILDHVYDEKLLQIVLGA